jgi:hypothetical protein
LQVVFHDPEKVVGTAELSGGVFFLVDDLG